jgi:hypothetical protein
MDSDQVAALRKLTEVYFSNPFYKQDGGGHGEGWDWACKFCNAIRWGAPFKHKPDCAYIQYTNIMHIEAEGCPGDA